VIKANLHAQVAINLVYIPILIKLSKLVIQDVRINIIPIIILAYNVINLALYVHHYSIAQNV